MALKPKSLRFLYNTNVLPYLYEIYKTVALPLTSRYPIGTNIYENEWDLLIILDACRVDALRQVSDEYEFLQDFDTIWSVGSSTPEWVSNTFRPDYEDDVARTAFVTSNGTYQWIFEMDEIHPELASIFGDVNFASWIIEHLASWDTVKEDDFYLRDQVWMYTDGPDNPLDNEALPETITDRAIAIARDHNPGRLLVHYREPHAPYTANAIAEDRELKYYEKNPWEALRSGVPLQKVWSAYLDELRYALDNVETLLNNVDAEIAVISADHGEAFGEWGFYSHPSLLPLPCVKKVPWITTTATDTGVYEPTIESEANDIDEEKLKNHLKELGYI